MKLIYKQFLGFIAILLIFWVGAYLTISFNKKELEEIVLRDTEVTVKEVLDKINRHIYSRYEIFDEYTEDTDLQEAVIKSNRDFEIMGGAQAYIDSKDHEWMTVPKEKVTPLMQKIISNKISEALRDKIGFYEKHYGYRVFGEVFITNKYGANVAQTGKTSDYRQDDEEWWQIAKRDGVFAQVIDYDASSEMYSIPVGLRIDDDEGQFIGVMKVVINIRDVIDIMKAPRYYEHIQGNNPTSYYLTTREGKLIYTNRKDKKFLEDVSYLLGDKKGINKTATHKHMNTQDGLDILAVAYSEPVGYKEFKGPRLVLIAQHNKQEIFSLVSKLEMRWLETALIVTLISMGIVYIFSRRITGNIKTLRDAAIKIGGGKLDTQIDIKSKDEIGELAQSFERMTRDLKNNTVTIDRLTEEVNRSFRAEQTILESEERFRSVLENANDAVIYVDSRGETIFWNRAAENIFGYSAEEIVGRQVAIIIPEKYRQAHYDGMNRIIKTGQSKIIGKTIELTGLKKDGMEFPIELSLSNWKIKNDIYFTAIIRDISGRKYSEEIIQRQVSRLSALRSIDKAIIGSLDLDVTLEVFLSHVMKELGVDAAAVLFLNKHTQMLEYLSGRGFRTDALRYTRLNLGESNAGRAAIERHIINIPDLRQDIDGFIRSEHFRQEDFVSYFAVPLAAKGEVIGVLEVFHRSPLSIESEWAEFLEAIANQGAIALDNSFLFQRLQRSNIELSLAYDRTIEGWAHALDLRDKETEGHSRRVTELTVRVAQEFRIKDEDLLHIRRGALLHDIGKMGIPDNILLKPGALTDEEWTIMKLHPIYARDLLYPIEYLRPAIDIPLSHHEKWDGTGYPTGLRGENIPLAARIFAVIDVWDALSSDRPYRPAWPKEKVKEFIQSQVGSHFDAGVVEIFLNTIKNKEEGKQL